MAGRQLEVWSNERHVGTLQDENDLWRFDYDDAWMGAEDGFSLSPELTRNRKSHVDGASNRPVQWYFDNLLPEEAMRTVLASEAKVPSDDAFGLLGYFGAESAGSLLLLSPGTAPAYDEGLTKLELANLSARIRNLPQASLTKNSPKKMSLAGAQHKMVVVMQDGKLYEPAPGRPSTHILKPNHPSEDYAASVANEYFCMRLAEMLGLDVPEVSRMYVPEPVYIVERFDRETAKNSGHTLRLHILDTCQLLNKSRSFKYSGASLDVLQEAATLCRSKTAARLRLFRWVIFNLLIGNNDNHLKNISFLVKPGGIEIAPAYDLVSTLAYSTRAVAGDKATWPNEGLTVKLGNATSHPVATFDDVVAAGAALGLARSTCERELHAMLRDLPDLASRLLSTFEMETEELIKNSPNPDEARKNYAGEMRLLRTIVSIIIADTVKQVSSSRKPPPDAAR